ncbi:hypothetical protein HanPI659440_Chr11g0417041 [Helianthus annuus]|nr:hypothetical protein HanPI659440_Chr11g0417041 [Helianthus annuus]
MMPGETVTVMVNSDWLHDDGERLAVTWLTVGCRSHYDDDDNSGVYVGSDLFKNSWVGSGQGTLGSFGFKIRVSVLTQELGSNLIQQVSVSGRTYNRSFLTYWSVRMWLTNLGQTLLPTEQSKDCSLQLRTDITIGWSAWLVNFMVNV